MTPNCPMRRGEVIDRYFMEHRAKLLDIAAFLDRLDRAEPDDDGGRGMDFRVTALRSAIAILDDGGDERAKRILETFSDPTSEPIATAAGMKGAHGAYDAGAERGA